MLVITLALTAVVYGQFELAKDRSVSQMRENVDQTAVQTADQIDAQIRRQKDYIGFYASRPRASDFDRSDEFLRGLLTNPYVFGGQVVSANGTVVAFEGDVRSGMRRETIGDDIGDRPYVRRPAQTGETYVTDPERIEGTDQYIVVVSAPIFEDGERVGVLAAALPINEFTFLTMVPPLETDVRTVSIQAGNRTFHESKMTFADNVSSTATVISTGWSVRVSRSRAALDARLCQMAILQVGSLVLVLSLVVGLAVWEYNANIRQAEKLLDGFQSLREGDYDHTPGLGSGEEWHQIREGFDDLADALAAREAEVREREQRIQVFNRVLRHNIRNDMTVVANYAEFAVEESDDPAVRNAAEKIAEHGWDLVDLGEKARRLGTGMEGEGTEPVETDVAAVVTDVAATVREQYPEADVSVEVRDERSSVAIPAFDAAVENVCENAVEHNDTDDPTVSVAVETITEDGEEWTRVAVADDGPGIPAHERAVLTDGEETDLDHGSGLGLWLVHWVVERSDGRLSFAENDPRGSVVRMDLRPADGD